MFYHKAVWEVYLVCYKAPNPLPQSCPMLFPGILSSEAGLPSPVTSSQSHPAQASPWLSSVPVAPASCEAASCLPQQASWRGVGEALEGWVLGTQEEGQDGSCASAQRVAYYNQAIVFGSTTLGTKTCLRALPQFPS